MRRCGWVLLNEPVYVKYHDEEWGCPEYEDDKLFELLLLESFQAGLSWICVLKKRECFRSAFDQFDYHKISCYDEEKIQCLLKDTGIIRSRRKIEAVIGNAKVFIKIQKEWGSFSNYIWHFTNGKVIKNITDNIPTTSSLSDEISKDLKKYGMKYVGSIIIYSYLQAIGIVNDHEKMCFCYERSEFL